MNDERRQRDEQARREAQQVFDRPLVLEAGAGTGKTTTLVARILAWCLGPGWERARAHAAADADDGAVAASVLRGVAAITFTEAAAAEMSARIAEAFAQVMRGALPLGVLDEALPEVPLREPRARALLGQLDWLVVRTIHAFCRRILAAFPLDAELHPGFQVDANGMLLAGVVREVLESRLRDAYAEPGDADYLRLAEWQYGPREIEETLLRAAESGLAPSALDDDPFSPERCGALLAGARGAVQALHAAERGALARVPARSKRTHALAAALAELAELLDHSEATLPAVQSLCERVHERFDAALRGCLREWGRGKLNRSEQGAIGERSGEFAAAAAEVEHWLAAIRALDPERLDSGRRVLRGLLADVERELRARGIVTFGALLRDTERLLACRPAVRERLRRGLDQLVVDEFQDTDETQCRIVSALALEGPADQRPGLFIVGDPKQSIYGWRQADLAAYERFVARVEQAGGRRRQLLVNYRSRPAILAEVDRLLAPVMERRAELQPAYASLVAERRDDGAAPVEHWIAWSRDPDTGAHRLARARETAELEAGAIASDIARVRREHGVAWREIAILLRSRSDLECYLEALRAERVPFAVEGDRSYYRRREVIDLAALVRCVVDANDHLSLLTWLRSPCVGVPDAALIPLWTRHFPDHVTRLRGPDAAALDALRELVRDAAKATPRDVPGIERIAGWEHALMAALETLALLRRCFECDPPDRFVEELRTRSLIEAIEAARYLGRYRVANLERFLRRLTADLCAARGDPGLVLRALRRRVREAEAEEEARPRDSAVDAVQVRTIHQAKGLDFEHVYLAQTHKRSGGEDDGEASWAHCDGRVEYRLFGASTPGFERVRQRRRRVAAAEQVRTLYVALTRARNRLVVSGAWPDAGARVEPERAGCHLELMRHRAGGVPDLPALWDELRAGGDHAHESEGVRWCFPVLRAKEPATDAADLPDAKALPSLERVASDITRLAARRQAARVRSARGFSAGAARDPLEHASEPAARGSLARELAATVGSVLHRVLESFDPDLPIAAEHARERALLERELGERAELKPALARGRELLARFQQGPLFPRLRSLGHDVARELPVLVPPDDAPDAPVGYVSGMIDLLYRDPRTGAWVIADYKTDRARSDDEIAALAGTYAAQGAVYQRAIRSGLGLESDPRFELWLLDAGRVLPVEPVHSPPP